MANAKDVRATDGAFTRMTRVQYAHDPSERSRLPQWSNDRWLPDSVYRPFTFRWAGCEFDLIAGPAYKQFGVEDRDVLDRDWLRIIRACRGLIVSLDTTLMQEADERALVFDQTLAGILRILFSERHWISSVVLMFNKADLIAGSAAAAESAVAQLADSRFRTVTAVCANAYVPVVAVPTSAWGFASKRDGPLRFPVASQPFNILEPIRCALGVSIGTNGAAESIRHSERQLSPSYDVALSYAAEDREYVEQVAARLRNRGIRVFYDRHELANTWGEDLCVRLSEIYGTRSAYVVIFVSKHYLTKSWTLYERRHARAHAVKGSRSRILPARFDETELPGWTSEMAYLDLRYLTPETTADAIVEKVRSGESS